MVKTNICRELDNSNILKLTLLHSEIAYNFGLSECNRANRNLTLGTCRF